MIFVFKIFHVFLTPNRGLRTKKKAHLREPLKVVPKGAHSKFWEPKRPEIPSHLVSVFVFVWVAVLDSVLLSVSVLQAFLHVDGKHVLLQLVGFVLAATWLEGHVVERARVHQVTAQCDFLFCAFCGGVAD